MQERTTHIQTSSSGADKRLSAFDALRGALIIAMVFYHTMWDLMFIRSMSFSWWTPAIYNPIRNIGVALFLLIAGMMCAKSSSNLQRGFRYAAVAALISLVTYVTRVTTPINFGIIFCMAACTLVVACLEALNIQPKGYVLAAFFMCFFILCFRIPSHRFGLGSYSLELPQSLYSSEYFAWLGFPGQNFYSGDYFPLIPYLFCYLAGTCLGNTYRDNGWPKWASSISIPPLEWVGTHSLWIYLFHQPIILLVINLFLGS